MNFDFNNPYASTRIPLFARNVVSTSHPLAAQAGLRMMLKGGNAVDAAIAAAAAMTIVEPVSNGLGSDSFCILWDGKDLHGLNASGRAPQSWTPEYFKRKYGNDAAAPPKRGMDAVTVPGAVSSWVALSERFGKLPFADLLEPAIEIAERGYLLSPVVQEKWSAATDELKGLPGFAASFLPWGRAPTVGELFQFKAAAEAFARLPPARARPSTAARSHAQLKSFPARTVAASQPKILKITNPSGSSRLAKITVATPCTRFRPTGRAFRRSSRSAFWTSLTSPACQSMVLTHSICRLKP